MRAKIGANSRSSSGRPETLVKIWMPRAPIFSTARSISATAALTLFIGTDATQPGNCLGCLAQISAMPSLARRASAGDSAAGATNSMAGIESVQHRNVGPAPDGVGVFYDLDHLVEIRFREDMRENVDLHGVSSSSVKEIQPPRRQDTKKRCIPSVHPSTCRFAPVQGEEEVPLLRQSSSRAWSPGETGEQPREAD